MHTRAYALAALVVGIAACSDPPRPATSGTPIACINAGESCASNAGACCGGSTCVRTQSGETTCSPTCTENSQCETACCGKLKDTVIMACAPTTYCMCTARSGSYVMSFVERSGNCGSLSEQIITPDQLGKPTACTGPATPSDDMCSVTLDISCPGATGTHIAERGKVDWSNDGSTGAAILQFVLTNDADGTVQCSSTYNVTFKRL